MPLIIRDSNKNPVAPETALESRLLLRARADTNAATAVRARGRRNATNGILGEQIHAPECLDGVAHALIASCLVKGDEREHTLCVFKSSQVSRSLKDSEGEHVESTGCDWRGAAWLQQVEEQGHVRDPCEESAALIVQQQGA